MPFASRPAAMRSAACQSVSVENPPHRATRGTAGLKPRLPGWRCGAAALCGLLPPLIATPAFAIVTISSGSSKNMTCANRVCSPTAPDANLYVKDFENLLVPGNVTVTTTGSGGVQANDIEIDAAVSWNSATTLTLDAHNSIHVKQSVSATGGGGLTIITNDGGTGGVLDFGLAASVNFWSLASILTINGNVYTLEDSVATLASAIAANPAGNYALANAYNALKDGTYAKSPIATEFSGTFEGLGNEIFNLSVNDPTSGDNVGLFAEIGSGNKSGGAIENIVLRNLSIVGNGKNVGGLVGLSRGTIWGAFTGGSVGSALRGASVGALAGASFGSLSGSAATGIVTGRTSASDGGLVGSNFGSIALSFSNCQISGAKKSGLGGLAGANQGAISESYALGQISGGDGADVGGLVGNNATGSTIAQAYSTTAVKLDRDTGGYKGGLIGADNAAAGSNTSDYWDTTTSNVTKLSEGAGNIKNDPGITGLTTTQLQSSLPSGFDPTIWAEYPNINGGLPYLIANPPR